MQICAFMQSDLCGKVHVRLCDSGPLVTNHSFAVCSLSFVKSCISFSGKSTNVCTSNSKVNGNNYDSVCVYIYILSS